MNIDFFEMTNVQPKSAYVFAGGMISKRNTEILDEAIDICNDLCVIKFAATSVPLEQLSYEIMVCKGMDPLKGRKLDFAFGGSSSILLFGCTAGEAISQRIIKESNDDPVLGFVLHVVSSAVVNTAMDMAMDKYRAFMKESGHELTRHRYSPGCGFINIVSQKQLYDILNLNKLGMKINESGVLKPDKSMISAAGVKAI